MKKIKQVLLGLTLIAGLIVGTGCSSNSSNSSPTSKISHMATTRTVTDMSGTKVKVPSKVTRVADLWHANNQVVLLLGGQKKLVATTQMIKQSPWFKTIDPKISKVIAPFAGNDLQTEELVKTKPDVVIAANIVQVKQARKAKVPTVNAMYQTFSGLRQSVNLTARVLGGTAPKIAKTYQKTLTDNLSYVKRQLKGVTNTPKVLHFVSATDLNKVDGTRTIVNEWIKAAGGQNALTQNGNMISVTTETLAKSNPDVIIVGSATTEEARAALKKNAVLSKLTAVKKNRVYGNPQGTFPWDRYSAEEALQVLWAAQKLHPDQFQDLDMVAKTKAFYQEFYHYQLNTVQVNHLLSGAASPQ